MGENLLYAVVAWADVQALTSVKKAALINACGQTSWGTCRRSITTPDETILKWNIDDPNPCDAAGIASTVLTHAEAIALMATSHWSEGI